jgi:uncharacterized protein YggE
MIGQVSDTGVTVSASGTASAAPDRAVLRLAAETSAPSVQAAMERATAAIEVMRSALLEAGVEASALRSTEASVYRDHDRGARGFIARFGLSATVNDVTSAGAAAQAALAAGADSARLEGLSYAHSDPAALNATAREIAFANARTKAEQLAGLAGRALGAVEEITERDGAGGGPIVPVPMIAAEAAAPMSFDAGEQEVSVSVTVRWAWA